MSPELADQLYAKYPDLFPDKVGFWCGDGWFKLIDDLLAKIDLIRRTTQGEIIIGCVKEKLATIRVYFSTKFPKEISDRDRELWWGILWDLECQAMDRSSTICEETGQFGEVCSKVGCLKTLCPEKAKELGFESRKVQS